MIKVIGGAAGAILWLATATSVYAQNNKPVRSGTFYEDRTSYVLTGTSTAAGLTLSLAQVPSDKFLNITNVSCGIDYSSAFSLGDVSLAIGTTMGGSETGRAFRVAGVPVRAYSANSTTYSSFNNSNLFIKIGPGRYPTLHASIQTGTSTAFFLSASCVIVGTLSDD